MWARSQHSGDIRSDTCSRCAGSGSGASSARVRRRASSSAAAISGLATTSDAGGLEPGPVVELLVGGTPTPGDEPVEVLGGGGAGGVVGPEPLQRGTEPRRSTRPRLWPARGRGARNGRLRATGRARGRPRPTPAPPRPGRRAVRWRPRPRPATTPREARRSCAARANPEPGPPGRAWSRGRRRRRGRASPRRGRHASTATVSSGTAARGWRGRRRGSSSPALRAGSGSSRRRRHPRPDVRIRCGRDRCRAIRPNGWNGTLSARPTSRTASWRSTRQDGPEVVHEVPPRVGDLRRTDIEVHLDRRGVAHHRAPRGPARVEVLLHGAVAGIVENAAAPSRGCRSRRPRDRGRDDRVRTAPPRCRRASLHTRSGGRAPPGRSARVGLRART